MTIDELNIYSTGLSTLFGVPEINMGEAGSKVTIQVPGLSAIELIVPDSCKENTKLFAHHIWKASILMSRILVGEHLSLEYCNQLQSMSVLELGAASGLPSIVCLAKGAEQVTSSDYPDPNIIDALKRNIAKNVERSLTRSTVVGHCWNNPETLCCIQRSSPSPDGRFDLVLLADTFWMPEQHDNLLTDLQRLVDPMGRVLAVAGLHTGRAVMEAFFSKAECYGFLVERLAIVKIPIGSGSGHDLDWQLIADECIPDDVEERKRFLFVYEMWFE